MVSALKKLSPKGKKPTVTAPKARKMPYEFADKDRRARAMQGYPENISEEDPMMGYLLENIETLWTPKLVHTSADWLVTQKEGGQPLENYLEGGPDIAWINSRYNQIILFLIDDTIGEEMGKAMKLYCEAYFLGCTITLVRPGDKLTETTRGGAKKVKEIPKDFVAAHEITVRKNMFGP